MSQKGSFINHLASNSKHVFKVPEIGDGVTFYQWSDRSAGTVTGVFNKVFGDSLIIQVNNDKATRIDSNGMSDSQTYSYETDYNGHVIFFRWSEKKSQWQAVEKNEKGRWVLSGERSISIGNRDAYHDYSF